MRQEIKSVRLVHFNNSAWGLSRVQDVNTSAERRGPGVDTVALVYERACHVFHDTKCAGHRAAQARAPQLREDEDSPPTFSRLFVGRGRASQTSRQLPHSPHGHADGTTDPFLPARARQARAATSRGRSILLVDFLDDTHTGHVHHATPT